MKPNYEERLQALQQYYNRNKHKFRSDNPNYLALQAELAGDLPKAREYYILAKDTTNAFVVSEAMGQGTLEELAAICSRTGSRFMAGG